MSKLLGLMTAAALLSSVTAFAQSTMSPNPTNSSPTTDSAAPSMTPDTSAPAAPADTAETGKPHHMHHHASKHMSAKDTDMSADKLNACMADATPTEAQENCLKQAANAPS